MQVACGRPPSSGKPTMVFGRRIIWFPHISVVLPYYPVRRLKDWSNEKQEVDSLFRLKVGSDRIQALSVNLSRKARYRFKHDAGSCCYRMTCVFHLRNAGSFGCHYLYFCSSPNSIDFYITGFGNPFCDISICSNNFSLTFCQRGSRIILTPSLRSSFDAGTKSASPATRMIVSTCCFRVRDAISIPILMSTAFCRKPRKKSLSVKS